MKTAYRLTVLVMIVCAALFALSSTAVAAPKLVYDDEFSGGSLNTSIWNATLPWGNVTNGGANELEHIYAANITQSNGEAVLKTDNAGKDSSFPYGSGAFTTQSQAFTYGYYEMRAKLPKGKGVWPAFWLVDWYGTHEIDIFELLGDKPNTVHMTYHYGSTQPYTQSFTGPDFSAGYHTFGVDWEANSITWYIDGVQRAQYTGAIKSNPLMICANTAVGGPGSWPGAPDSTTSFPQYYNIDYIRVYDSKPVPNTAPVGNSDSYATANGAALNVPANGVLANDTDAEGDSISAALSGQASNGTVSMASNGSFTYTPNAGFSGIDTFTYTASDGQAACAPVTVTIQVAPAVVQSFITVGDSYTTGAGASLDVPASGVLSNDQNSASSAPVQAKLDRLPAHGTISFAPDGSFIYTPNAGFAGADWFVYGATVGKSTSAAKVTLNVVAPKLATLAKPAAKKRSAHVYRISGKASLSKSVQAGAPRVLRIEVERKIAGQWRGYRSAYVTNPGSSYSANVRMCSGTFRVRTSISVSGASWALARSGWTGVRVR